MRPASCGPSARRSRAGKSAMKSSCIAIRTMATTKNAMAAIRCSRRASASGVTKRRMDRSRNSRRVQDRQLMERPKHLTWEEAACYTLTLATTYRMFFGHRPHILRPGHNVLVWGASGGLGLVRRAALRGVAAPTPSASSAMKASAISCCRWAPRASSIARISNAGARCPRSTRRNMMRGRKKRANSARRSGTSPARATTSTWCSSIPARSTFPVSCLVVKRGGMVVFCAGTTGYNITFDARYVWMRQKRIQGSHFANLHAGEPGQPPGRRAAHRSVHVGSVLRGPTFRARTPRCGRTSICPATWRCW